MAREEHERTARRLFQPLANTLEDASPEKEIEEFLSFVKDGTNWPVNGYEIIVDVMMELLTQTLLIRKSQSRQRTDACLIASRLRASCSREEVQRIFRSQEGIGLLREELVDQDLLSREDL